MKKISVIIPIYNTRAYLKRCLDSVCNQIYRNLEIICVDDGSTDGSAQIADNYAVRDARVRVIHKENGGESAARNVGLKVATGDYIAFVDCDDWLELDMYESMMNAMNTWNVDLVATGYFMDTDSESKEIKNKSNIENPLFGRKKLFQYVYIRDEYRGVTSWIWCKLFKRELLQEKGEWILFDEGVRFGADIYFFLQAIARVNRAYYVDGAFYHYYQRCTSTSHTQNLDIAYEIVDIYQRMIDYCVENDVEPEIVPWLQRFKVYRATLVAQQAYEQSDAVLLQRCQRVMNELETVYMEKNAQYPERIERYKTIVNYIL